MSNIYSKLPKPFFVLAPMDDVTDSAFRRLVAECAAPDLFFTEFASADGLQSPGKLAVGQRLVFTKTERPLIAQIWGKNPDSYRQTAADLVEMGFDGVDINFGCPVPKVIKNGCCSALIYNRELAKELIEATFEGAAGKIPVSFKCRIGFKDIDLTWIEFLMSFKPACLTIHGRTTKEQSRVPNHWEVFPEIVAIRDRVAPETLIVGNGDIETRAQGEELAKKYDLDGVMIGRGIFKDPFVFAQDSPWPSYTKAQKIELYLRHIQLYGETFPNKAPALLKKFAKVYINGFPGASELRVELMSTDNLAAMKQVLKPHTV